MLIFFFPSCHSFIQCGTFKTNKSPISPLFAKPLFIECLLSIGVYEETMSTNQYGRRTWDVDEYAQRKRVKEARGGFVSSVHQETGTLFGSDQSWFVCEPCRRRFKDTQALAVHCSSRQHLENVPREEEPAITLANVVVFVKSIKE